jgi:diguanylate cyclase (GGDEF)-like protein/PAS domain S-box-containing protein
MSQRLEHRVRRSRKTKKSTPASAHSAVKQGFVVGLAGGILTAGLVALDYRQRIFWAMDASGRGSSELGTLLNLAIGVALATALVMLLLYGRFLGLTRAESHGAADLGAGGETLRALLGTVSQGVLMTDPTGRITLFNPAAESLFGRSAEKTLGIPIKTLIPDLSLADEPSGSRIDPQAGPRLHHLVGVRPNGRLVPMRLMMRMLILDGKVAWLLIADDMTDQERSARRLEFLEHRDQLTGLQNRPTFESILCGIAPLPSDGSHEHALCLIDVDRFKVINDAVGHAAGTKVLEQLGKLVKTKLAPATALARLGGDEFAALFVGPSVRDAHALCEDLLRTTRNFLFTWEERSFDITLSIGLVFFDAAQIGAIEALGQADIACRIAKDKGRDRIHVYSHGDAESMRHYGDIALVPIIGRALTEGRFLIIAQPIKPLQDDAQPTHYEILARILDEKGEPLVPDAFIEAAERHILMPAIDRWIINHVFSHQAEQIRAWHDTYPDRFMLAINLSGTTLMDDSFAPYLKRQFADHDIPYPAICFEITETAAVADLRRARLFMEDIRALGSTFAVDDFGTGFASYAYLKFLPVDYLKIDGSFVRDLMADPVDLALVSSINHLGHVLGLKTIAEWAETPELIEKLRKIGVDYAQGFGVGKPIRLEDLRLHQVLCKDASQAVKMQDNSHRTAS